MNGKTSRKTIQPLRDKALHIKDTVNIDYLKVGKLEILDNKGIELLSFSNDDVDAIIPLLIGAAIILIVMFILIFLRIRMNSIKAFKERRKWISQPTVDKTTSPSGTHEKTLGQINYISWN